MTSREQVEEFYRSRLEETRRLAILKRTAFRYCIAAGTLCAVAGVVFLSSPWLALPAVIGLLYAVRKGFAFQQEGLTLARSGYYFRNGIARMEGEWFSEHTGADYTPTGHPFAADLDITGEASLFSRLCTARTEAGRRRLAEYLLSTPSHREAERRQRDVRERIEAFEMRERIALLGGYEAQDCRAHVVHEWLNAPAVKPSALLILLCRAGTVLLAAALALCAFQIIPWNHSFFSWSVLAPAAATTTALQLCLRFAMRHNFSRLIVASCQAAPDLRMLSDGLQLMGAGGSTAIRKGSRLTSALASSTQGLLDWPAWLLLADIHQAALIARWRETHAGILRESLDQWAECDALHAIAGYAFEHPLDAWPQLSPVNGVFEACAMAHPLIDSSVGVRNDVTLNAETPYFVLSGSNMAGKSTLLRAIGTNMVLAMAGAPVRAASATVSLSRTHASLRASDSLNDGRSRFLAETQRIRAALKDARAGEPVLFLVDELLGGTNSRDRRIASEKIVHALASAGAIGVISTHDLALTEIGSSNFHMSCIDEEHPLDFDYTVKPGIYSGSNALAIVKLALE